MRALTPAQILALVPQRQPMRFIDEIVEVDADHIVGNYTWKSEDCAGYSADDTLARPLPDGGDGRANRQRGVVHLSYGAHDDPRGDRPARRLLHSGRRRRVLRDRARGRQGRVHGQLRTRGLLPRRQARQLHRVPVRRRPEGRQDHHDRTASAACGFRSPSPRPVLGT